MPSVLSLYSGAGGLDYGFHLAGFTTKFAYDSDASAIQTFNELIPGKVGICKDIDAAEMPSRGSIDVVIGGPPCQGFSVAGNMDPNDPRSRHVWRFLEVVGQISPSAFVMENVRHLGENDRWASIRNGLVNGARAMGYQTRLFVLRASDFGVPQNRDRMFLIGAKEFEPTEPIRTSAELPPTARLALNELPRVGRPGNSRLATAEITLAVNPVLRRSPFAGMLFNGAGRPINLDAPCLTLPASMGGNKTPIIDQQWLDGVTARSWVHDYHEHLWNGGSPYGMRDLPNFLRRLTIEEAARLQSFPTDMKWKGPNSAVFRQIGNAVPPLLAKAVALSLMPLLGSPRVTPSRTTQSFSIEELIQFSATEMSLF